MFPLGLILLFIIGIFTALSNYVKAISYSDYAYKWRYKFVNNYISSRELTENTNGQGRLKNQHYT
jgi:hypothetical protein